MTTEVKHLYTCSEAAIDLGIETARVRQMIRTGEIGCFKFVDGAESTYRIGRSHLNDYKARQDAGNRWAVLA